MTLNYEFIKREIAGDVFLVPVGEAAKVFSGLIALNSVASYIWDILPDTEREEDIVNGILEEYEVDRDQAAADVSEFLGKLKEMKILG